eukprot:2884211-Prymnesium_polylepis.2
MSAEAIAAYACGMPSSPSSTSLSPSQSSTRSLAPCPLGRWLATHMSGVNESPAIPTLVRWSMSQPPRANSALTVRWHPDRTARCSGHVPSGPCACSAPASSSISTTSAHSEVTAPPSPPPSSPQLPRKARLISGWRGPKRATSSRTIATWIFSHESASGPEPSACATSGRARNSSRHATLGVWCELTAHSSGVNPSFKLRPSGREPLTSAPTSTNARTMAGLTTNCSERSSARPSTLTSTPVRPNRTTTFAYRATVRACSSSAASMRCASSRPFSLTLGLAFHPSPSSGFLTRSSSTFLISSVLNGVRSTRASATLGACARAECARAHRVSEAQCCSVGGLWLRVPWESQRFEPAVRTSPTSAARYSSLSLLVRRGVLARSTVRELWGRVICGARTNLSRAQTSRWNLLRVIAARQMRPSAAPSISL